MIHTKTVCYFRLHFWGLVSFECGQMRQENTLRFRRKLTSRISIAVLDAKKTYTNRLGFK